MEQKDLTVDIKLEEQNKTNIEHNNIRTESTVRTIEQKSTTWEEERTTGILQYQEELAGLSSIDIESEIVKIQELEAIQNELQTLILPINNMSTSLENDSNKLHQYEHEAHILLGGKCPYCEQSYVNVDKISEVNKKIYGLNISIEDLSVQLIPLLEQEDILKNKLDMFLAENRDMLSISECQTILHNIDKINDKISTIKDDSINPYLEQIGLLQQNITEYDYSTILELNKLDSHYKILVKMLTDSKSFIRKNIVAQYIPFFNEKCNYYLELLESPNRITINDDLTVDINYMHSTLSFGNLSTGERIRASFAISLAFNDFNALLGSDWNVLFIDEIFDSGLDASGIHLILKLLKNRNESIFIISHRDEIIPEVDDVITIIKKGGFSNVS
jgi:DNA repair exonuclease SbcCD ATPase subunit